MKSADGNKYKYEKSQLIEVICQLRYPTILSIETETPAAFQERIRERFPRYNVVDEKLPTPQGVKTTKNHSFVSTDGRHRLSLTKDFIALSTMSYSCWEEFASWLDEPLGQFISVYKPAFFQRIGLRYVNGISRQLPGLENRRWNDLIQSRYLGVLDDDSVDEAAVGKCSVDIEMKLEQSCSVKLHAGPGLIKRAIRTPQGIQQIQEKQPRFILDLDVFSVGDVQLHDAARVLENVHEQCDGLFSAAITNVLHEAMEPVIID